MTKRKLYADENFSISCAVKLSLMGYDVITAKDDDKDNKKTPDSTILARAVELGRIVLTHDRKDFARLHEKAPNHFGIAVCSRDKDEAALAQRIHEALSKEPDMKGRLIRINRPG